MRFAIATLVVSLAKLAHADAPPAPPASAIQPASTTAAPASQRGKPDEIADIESREANLEADEPRSGFTTSFAVAAGMMFGGDVGVGRGPGVSIRLGHVATRRTVITFEFVGSSALHKRAIDDAVLNDTNYGLLVGAQTYRREKLWLRGAGGLTFFVKDAMSDGSGGTKGPTSVSGLVGAGLDYKRWGYFVLGGEVTALASISGDGMKLQMMFSPLTFSYY